MRNASAMPVMSHQRVFCGLWWPVGRLPWPKCCVGMQCYVHSIRTVASTQPCDWWSRRIRSSCWLRPDKLLVKPRARASRMPFQVEYNRRSTCEHKIRFCGRLSCLWMLPYACLAIRSTKIYIAGELATSHSTDHWQIFVTDLLSSLLASNIVVANFL